MSKVTKPWIAFKIMPAGASGQMSNEAAMVATARVDPQKSGRHMPLSHDDWPMKG